MFADSKHQIYGIIETRCLLVSHVQSTFPAFTLNVFENIRVLYLIAKERLLHKAQKWLSP